MNENLDLTKILDGCPKGTGFYNTVYGKVSFVGIRPNKDYPIKINLKCGPEGAITAIAKDGRIRISCDGECTLFPSKTQRDWSKFVRFWDKSKVERFDQKTWKSGDEMLFRLGETTPWRFGLFSHMFSDDFGQEVVCTTDGLALLCIPYNDNTKHLYNTTDDCPDYYKWWKK